MQKYHEVTNYSVFIIVYCEFSLWRVLREANVPFQQIFCGECSCGEYVFGEFSGHGYKKTYIDFIQCDVLSLKMYFKPTKFLDSANNFVQQRWKEIQFK